MMMLCIKFQSEYYINKNKWKFFWILTSVFSFLIPSVLLGLFHQRGQFHLMSYLRNEIDVYKEKSSFLFLMPCHSTPLYSHLHQNVTVKFLECEPPLKENSYDESDDFFNYPIVWLNNYWDNQNLPTHIALFDNIDSSISSFLNNKGYKMDHKIFHTVFALKKMGRYILVYKYYY